jgi:ATP-dependent DNA helicase
LEKASEYSNFIRNDLEELQFQMTEEAQKKLERAERKRKKDGGGSSSSTNKKKKTANGSTLKTAIDKDAVYRAGSRPIFIQQPNLSEGCYLKDYQLEGVRWLVSLYENGVSGILADEVCSIERADER